MCWNSIFEKLIKQGKTGLYLIEKINMLLKFSLIVLQEKLELYAVVLKNRAITEIDLDTYVANGWISEDDKITIINLSQSS